MIELCFFIFFKFVFLFSFLFVQKGIFGVRENVCFAFVSFNTNMSAESNVAFTGVCCIMDICAKFAGRSHRVIFHGQPCFTRREKRRCAILPKGPKVARKELLPR